MKYFVAGSTARTVADLAGIHRNTAVRFFHKLRKAIARKQQERAAQFAGEIELDESYFGGIRKGNRTSTLQAVAKRKTSCTDKIASR